MRQIELPRDAEAILHERRSEAHTSELQSQPTISYAVFCLKNTTDLQSPDPSSHTVFLLALLRGTCDYQYMQRAHREGFDMNST